MVLSIWINAAAFVEGNAIAIAQDVATVTLAALHTGARRQVTDNREEISAGGGAGRSAVGVVAVWRAGQGCRKQ